MSRRLWFGTAVTAVTIIGTTVGWSRPANALVMPSTNPVATQLAVTTQPQPSVLYRQSFTVEVSVEDSGGNVVTSDNTDVVTVSKVTPAPNVYSCPDTAVVTNGVAIFNCTFYSNGTYQITFESGSLTPATTASFTVSGVFLGYWLTGRDGGVFALGGAPFEGSLPGHGVSVHDIVGMAATPTGRGYWLVGSDGGVFAFGDAPYLGSLPGEGTVVGDIVGIVAAMDGPAGYWLVGANGAVYPFGISPYEGSLPGSGVAVHDIVGMAPTFDDMGYWLVGADGGVFAFGDAPFEGSLPGSGEHVKNVVGISRTNGGTGGYWLSSSNGAVANFGSDIGGNPLSFSHGPLTLNAPIAEIAPSFAPGYLLFGKDGGVFAYDDASYEGSLPGLGVHVRDIVGGAALEIF